MTGCRTMNEELDHDIKQMKIDEHCAVLEKEAQNESVFWFLGECDICEARRAQLRDFLIDDSAFMDALINLMIFGSASNMGDMSVNQGDLNRQYATNLVRLGEEAIKDWAISEYMDNH